MAKNAKKPASKPTRTADEAHTQAHPSREGQTQAYDNLLKRLVEHQAEAILPLFFPDLKILRLEELTVEMLVPPRRGDRVYKAYRQRPDGTVRAVILQVEYETGDNPKMDKRLHVYHAILYEKYELPVYSLLVYPFEVTGVTSPMIEADDDRVLLAFTYRTLPLARQSARAYVEQGAVPLYGLLPVMEDTSDELLLKAIDDMVEYYGDNESLLRDELLCFRVMLARAKRLPEAELLRVERRVHMFDSLLEDDPWVKEKVIEGEARGEARGKAIGELNQARETLVRFVQRRFPALVELAQSRMEHAEQIQAVNALMEQLWFAADEYAARALLENRQP